MLPEAVFVEMEDWKGLGSYVLLIGPSTQVRADVISIQAGYLCGDLCGSGTEYFFRWDGAAWVPATADELGLPRMMWAS